ncbi:hypothetical protein AAES_165355 [Amazona aestiva]|uniref:Uncharacterized protein n=1 Tax=Amazona aestiva TaxID=12930 RepID=A0A0Q3NZK7_AMAAE|nr:hypothetical protein AAES_165355 [Amazona aestiva]
MRRKISRIANYVIAFKVTPFKHSYSNSKCSSYTNANNKYSSYSNSDHNRQCSYSNSKHSSYTSSSDNLYSYPSPDSRYCSHSNHSDYHCSYTTGPIHANICCPCTQGKSKKVARKMKQDEETMYSPLTASDQELLVRESEEEEEEEVTSRPQTSTELRNM